MREGFAAVALALGTAIGADAPSALPIVVIHAPAADVRLEVASTDPDRSRGLMDRAILAPHTGMLFVFDRDAAVEFWMKDTLVPLDMIFVAADGTVRSVFANVPTVPAALPDANIPRESGTAKYVIELGAGEAEKDGIVDGVRLAVPDVHA